MPSALAGQVALITGGTRGIGLAIAKTFARHGMRIAICARRKEQLADAVRQLEALDAEVLGVPADVTNAAEVEQFVNEALKRFGRLDVLVNNAGTGGYGPIDQTTEEDLQKVLDVNLRGVFLASRAVFPIMREKRRGYIITISSICGKEAYAEISAYCASKFASVGFTEALLKEGIDSGIRTTSICPGMVDTEMVEGAGVPPEEMLKADDIAEACLFLLSLSEKAVVKEIVLQRAGAIE
ncbi:MAG TPA: SDR family NAD(P)-dependent oxidoreductase [Planctomycetota bacterium]|nr:SDR family NAD(P)-dependent oxidoreductase [Planctomycetota bacterium]